MTTLNFTTKQEGYGRQGLYFSFDGEKYFIQSVFPNVEEYFGITYENDCFYNEETKTYTDCDGNETTPYTSLDGFLFNNFKEEIGRILYESLDHEVYDYDFDEPSYEEIAEWAINY